MRKVWRRWAFAAIISLGVHAALIGAMLWRKAQQVAPEAVLVVELIELSSLETRKTHAPARAAPRPFTPRPSPPLTLAPIPAAPFVETPTPAAPDEAGRTAAPDDEALARAVVPFGPVDCRRRDLTAKQQRRCGTEVRRSDDRFAVPAERAAKIPRFAMDPGRQAVLDAQAEHKRACREDYRGAPTPPGRVTGQGGGPAGLGTSGLELGHVVPSLSNPCL